MKTFKLCLLTGLLSILNACVSMAVSSHAPYPEEWWKPVPKSSAASWEVLPQEAGPNEVVVSKRNDLGILSNFAATSFEYEGKTYASVEGFWQMLKYPEGPGDERLKNPAIRWPYSRDEVARMTAFDAKEAGNRANEIMKRLGISWVTYNGKKISYLEKSQGDFYQLILAAEWAKLNQNPQVKNILLKTGTLKLIADHHQPADSAPAWKYCDIWMEIRAQLAVQP